MMSPFEKIQNAIPGLVERFDVIDSTSLYVKRCISSGQVVPALVLANAQTNGQGRVGKSFYSPADTGLYLTFAFSSDGASCEHLTPRISLAVQRSVKKVFDVDLGVKWVNDLYLNGKKVAGILCQNLGNYFAIGIGINLQTPHHIPEDLQKRMGALDVLFNEELKSDLVISIYHEILRVIKLPDSAVLAQFRSSCIHLDRLVTIDHNCEKLSGICVGIADDFSLLIRINGVVSAFRSGMLTLQ